MNQRPKAAGINEPLRLPKPMMSLGLVALVALASLGMGCTTPSLVKRTCAHETVASFQALLNRVDPTNATGDYTLFRYVLHGEIREAVNRFIAIREAGSQTTESAQQMRELDLFFEMSDELALWPEERSICQADPRTEAVIRVVVYEPRTLMSYDVYVTLKQMGSKDRARWMITAIEIVDGV